MKQRKQIAEMNERGQQLKMMADWRRAVMKMEGQELDLLVEEVEHKLGGVEITDNGRAELKTLLKRHGYTTILEAIDRSVERYADWRDGQATSASIRHVFSGFDKIARYSKLPKTVQDAHYCRGILKNRLPDHVTPGSDRWAQCLTVLELALEYYPSREIKEFCKEVSDWAEWVDGMDAMIGIAETRDA